METRFVESAIYFEADAQKVWEALTDPEITPKYMFGCRTVSVWEVGSTLTWRAEYEGKEMDFVKGHIVEMEPGKRLVYTAFDPNNTTMEDIPQNYLTITYSLEPQGTGTHFTVTQGDYNLVADGDRRYEEAYDQGRGWSPLLEEIKKIVEA